MTQTLPLNVVVLAAGEGTRMKSALPKVLHPLAGRTMLGHVLAVADTLEALQTVVIVAENTIDQVRATFGPRYTYVVQAERLGTGHAVLQAQPALQGAAGDVLVLYGDSPLIQPETARMLVAARRDSGALVGLLSFYADPPTGYGRVLRDAAGAVVDLVEERNATAEQRAVSEANSGFMVFDGPWLWRALTLLPRNPLKGEYYLTDLVGMAVRERGQGAAIAVAAPDPRDAWGCNDRVQLAEAERVLRERILATWIRAGVTIVDPAATYIDADVHVGVDTTLLPGTILRGGTSIGANCTIGPYATLVDATVGDGAHVTYALIEKARVAPGATIGPFAHIQGDA